MSVQDDEEAAGGPKGGTGRRTRKERRFPNHPEKGTGTHFFPTAASQSIFSFAPFNSVEDGMAKSANRRSSSRGMLL
jgi:hypothetical protein